MCPRATTPTGYARTPTLRWGLHTFRVLRTLRHTAMRRTPTLRWGLRIFRVLRTLGICSLQDLANDKPQTANGKQQTAKPQTPNSKLETPDSKRSDPVAFWIACALSG
jgi:hypothetical protein